MHPERARVLAGLEEISRLNDDALRQGLAVACSPSRYGWEGSLLTATVMLPMTAFSALMTDISIIMLSHSSDAPWEKAFPTAPNE